MIAMRMRKTAFKTALKVCCSWHEVHREPSQGIVHVCTEISPGLRCFWRVASGFRRFEVSFGRPLRNVCLTDCICSIRTGRRTTRRSSKNLKI